MKKLIILLPLYLISCNTECKEIDISFRPHIVTHHHKSKIYKYYHTTPCSNCVSIKEDLRMDNRNFITYLDNGNSL